MWKFFFQISRLWKTPSLSLRTCGVSGLLFLQSVSFTYANSPEVQVLDAFLHIGISEKDLPPHGTRSLFDHLLKENGGIPFPFEKLMDLIASYQKDGQPPVAVLMPDARSIAKADANFKTPRMVVGAHAQPPQLDQDFGINLRNRLFLGYIEPANTIEVISYNEGAGRFEFQLVKDYYQGGVPKIVYTRRAICLSCHQNQAPIFPVRPWEETNAHPLVYDQILKARDIAENAAKVSTYRGVPLINTLSAPETIDALTDSASMMVTTQHIWVNGCGGDQEGSVECRRLMLQLALRFAWDPGTFNPGTGHTGVLRSPEEQSLLKLQAILWPRENIILHNPNILNRNPFEKRGESKGMVASLMDWFRSKRKGERALDDLAPLPPDLNPITQRLPKKILKSDASDGIFGIAQFFTHNDIRWLKQLSDVDFNRIAKAVQTEAMHPWLQPRPFQRIPVMNVLLKELGIKKMPTNCCETDEGMSTPLFEGVKPLAIAEGSPMKLYQTYCFACHRGNPASRLDFMSGDSEDEVWGNMAAVPEIREVLAWEKYKGTSGTSKTMPPADAYQRQALDRAGKATREAMIEALPSFLY